MCFSFDLLDKDKAESVKRLYKTFLILFTALSHLSHFCVKEDLLHSLKSLSLLDML